MAERSNKPVYVAVGAGAAIAAAKFVAAAFTGSASMLAEGIHSTVDACNDSLLLVGRSRADKPPDKMHPFGHGKELYFWTTVVALMILGAGGGVTIVEAIGRLIRPEDVESPIWNYVVLGLAAAFEGYSCFVTLKEFRKEKGDRGFWEALRAAKDPTTATVLLEDLAALAGVVVALIGVSLNQLLGSPYPDAIASLVIGLILVAVAIFLVRESRDLLVGERADPALIRAVREKIESDEAVEEIADPLTMHLGPSEVLLNLGVRFRPGLNSEKLEDVIDRLEAAIRKDHPEVRRIFLEVDSPGRRNSDPQQGSLLGTDTIVR